MGKLRVLPGNVANMIAAGEVVGRPASVVKELMENAVDAGALSVDVVVSDAGRTLIQVIDNGSGMSRGDAVLCFERHATSKIATAEDLEGICTYGFRGEALASIAAVSEVTLKTRRREDPVGVKVSVSAGNASAGECSCPVGSNFEVRNLFYNTPARRKFLKSDNVELKHIAEEFTRVALSKPDVNFSLTHNGRQMFVLKAAKSLKFRILDLLGRGVTGEMVDIDVQTSILKVKGFVGRPDTARKTPSNQYFFVNGRFFKSAYLHKAVMNAYEELIPDGYNPTYFIFLDVDTRSIDVNIHPTKTEIKFEDDRIIFQALYACVKETLGKNSFGAGIDFETEGTVPLPQLGRNFEEFRSVQERPAAPSVPDEPYNPFEPMAENRDFSRAVVRNNNYGALFEDNRTLSSRALVLSGKYILTPAASGLMIVSVRRARERILYERSLNALSRGEHVTQTALFPVEIPLGVQQVLLFKENAGVLEDQGFDIEVKEDGIVVNGVPEGYSCEEGKVLRMIEDIQYILAEGVSSVAVSMQSSLAQKFAVLGASSADEITSPAEAAGLLDALFSCENSSLTANGRKIAVIVPFGEIENKF